MPLTVQQVGTEELPEEVVHVEPGMLDRKRHLRKRERPCKEGGTGRATREGQQEQGPQEKHGCGVCADKEDQRSWGCVTPRREVREEVARAGAGLL